MMEREWAKAKNSKVRSDSFELDLVDESASVFLFRLILLGSKAAVGNMSQEEEETWESSNMALGFQSKCGTVGSSTVQELPCMFWMQWLKCNP